MLTTAKKVIKEALTYKNLDEGLLKDQIPLAQIKYVKKALGEDLYSQIVSENDAQSFTGLNETLLKTYIQPMLARYVIYEALPLIRSEITSNGINIPDPDFSAAATDKSYADVRQKMMSDAELYLDEMREYMNDNTASFPLWNCGEDISHSELPYLY
jgi:hypothetical protein